MQSTFTWVLWIYIRLLVRLVWLALPTQIRDAPKKLDQMGCYSSKGNFSSDDLDEIREEIEFGNLDQAEKLVRAFCVSGPSLYYAYCMLCTAWLDQDFEQKVIDFLQSINNHDLAARVSAYLASKNPSARYQPFVEIFFLHVNKVDVYSQVHPLREAFAFWIIDRPDDAARVMENILFAEVNTSFGTQLREAFIVLLNDAVQIGHYANARDLLNSKGNLLFEDEREQLLAPFALAIEEVERLLSASEFGERSLASQLLQEVEGMWPKILEAFEFPERLPWQILRIGCCYLQLDEASSAKKWLVMLNHAQLQKFGDSEYQEMAKIWLRKALRNLASLNLSYSEEIYRGWRDNRTIETTEELESFLASGKQDETSERNESNSLPPLQKSDLEAWVGHIRNLSLADLFATNIQSVLLYYFERMHFSDENQVKYLLSQLTESFPESLWASRILIRYLHASGDEDSVDFVLQRVGAELGIAATDVR